MKFVINAMVVLIFFKKQIWYKFQIMLKNSEILKIATFSYTPAGLIILNFSNIAHFTTIIQDSRMRFVINPMDILIFFNKQIWYKFQIMLKKQQNSGNCNFVIRISSRSSGYDFSEFHYIATFISAIQDVCN